MKMIIIATWVFMLNGAAYPNEFINLVKKTESVYSQNFEVDANNPGNIYFETLLNNQKAFLTVSASYLNSSFISIINTDASSMKANRNVHVHDLIFIVDEEETPSESCSGVGIQESDTNCEEKNCTITQRVISQCNISQCWTNNPSSPRELLEPVSENFILLDRVDISDCIPNNIGGIKHKMKMSVQNSGPTNLNGGTINLNLHLKNDSYSQN